MPAPVTITRKALPTPCVLGLDMSLEGTGACILRRGVRAQGDHWLTRHELPFLGTLKPASTGPQRLAWIEQELLILITQHRPVLVAIEGYAHGARFKAHALGEVGGLARLTLWKHGIPFVEVAPPQLKLFASGYGASKKPAMRKAIREKWGVDIRDNNQVDAYALAQLAMIATAPDHHCLSAHEYDIATELRYCHEGKAAPFPLLSRRM